MQSPPIPDPAFSAAWKDVLGRMEQALAQVEAEAAAREQALAAVPAVTLPDPDRLAGLIQQLEPEGVWLRPLEVSVRQVEQIVAETGAALQAEEEALRGWLTWAAACGLAFHESASGGGAI
jgi:hypothetical protein